MALAERGTKGQKVGRGKLLVGTVWIPSAAGARIRTSNRSIRMVREEQFEAVACIAIFQTMCSYDV